MKRRRRNSSRADNTVCIARRERRLKANRRSAAIAANNAENLSHCKKSPATSVHRAEVSGSEGRVRRLNSDGIALQFGHEVVAGADAEGHDGERGILARIRSETGSVHDKEILDVVSLLKLVED